MVKYIIRIEQIFHIHIELHYIYKYIKQVLRDIVHSYMFSHFNQKPNLKFD